MLSVHKHAARAEGAPAVHRPILAQLDLVACKRSSRPPSWVDMEEEEKAGSTAAKVPAVGSEVFVHWKENKAHMYFDGVIADVSADAQVASMRYNDGDREDGLAAGAMFVRVY